MKIAISQICSSNNLERNITLMEKHVEKASREGATLIIFPEFAYFIGKAKEEAETIKHYDELLTLFCSWGKKYQIAIIPGTLREPAQEGKFFNTLLAIGSNGNIICKYRKVFLYKATLPNGNFDETKYCIAGNDIVVFRYNNFTIGVSICFDIRFPEFFRSLKAKGAEIVVVPASFPIYTGKAHWDLLTRIRAIENQFFLLAPAQVGIIGSGIKTYGHSRIISPWGDIMCELEDSEDVACAHIDHKLITDAKSKIDLWASRREDLFPYR